MGADSAMPAFVAREPNGEPTTYGLRERGVTHLVFQLESGANGTRHYQGYIRFKSRLRFNTAKKTLLMLFGKAPHIEAMKGSRFQNLTYCTKDEGRLEGPWAYPCADDEAWLTQQGKRTDLDTLATMVRDGSTVEELLDSQPGNVLKYIGHIQKLSAYVKGGNVPRWRDVTVDVFWGPSGTGKSWLAREIAMDRFGEDPFPVSGGSTTFRFEGYDGQQSIILDDFRGSWFQLNHLLRLLDGYRVRINQKGSSTWAAWTHVFITSNLPIDCWYGSIERPVNPATYAALCRRIKNVYTVERSDGNWTTLCKVCDQEWWRLDTDYESKIGAPVPYPTVFCSKCPGDTQMHATRALNTFIMEKLGLGESTCGRCAVALVQVANTTITTTAADEAAHADEVVLRSVSPISIETDSDDSEAVEMVLLSDSDPWIDDADVSVDGSDSATDTTQDYVPETPPPFLQHDAGDFVIIEGPSLPVRRRLFAPPPRTLRRHDAMVFSDDDIPSAFRRVDDEPVSDHD